MHGGRYGSLALFLLATLLLVALPGCGGGGGGGPTAPSTANVAGLWVGVQTLTGASGCGCVGSIYRSLIGFTTNYTAQINQTGPSITARSTNTETGLWCDSTGTVGSETFTLNAVNCAAEGFRMTCLNGQKRDLFMVSASSQGTVSGNRASGTGSETWNCYNSWTGASAGVLNLQTTFQMDRR